MRFFKKYFTKHHFFHAPHKWFLALLLSPIHAAEVHYQNRYHLRFAHARKLFLFDLLLVASVFVIAGTALFIFTYDPTVTKQVNLTLSASTDKIKNGERVTYTVKYQNKSPETLTRVHVSFNLPPGFVMENAEPSGSFTPQNKTFSLPILKPGASGQAQISGLFLGNVGEKIVTVAHFSYQQEKRTVDEQKVATLFTTARGSLIETRLEAKEKIIHQSPSEIKLSLINTSDQTHKNVRVKLSLPNGTIVPLRGGSIIKNVWSAPLLEPHSTSSILFSFTPIGLGDISEAQIMATPEMDINGRTIVLDIQTVHTWKVVSPQVDFTAHFANQATASPGETLATTITVHNKGNIALKNASVFVPFSSFIDSQKFKTENRGAGEKNGLRITGKHHASLLEIAPGSTISLPLTVPVKANLEGTNAQAELSPVLTAELADTEGQFTQTTKTSPLKIGTRLSMETQIRYYTAEGDQLGRGPIPPRVGKETKYAAIVRMYNSTSQVENVRFTADVPAHIHWTGRTSVSTGQEPSFDASNGRISWEVAEVLPGQTVSIFMELSFTPDASHVGTTPIILKNISLTGIDTFINKNLTLKNRDLDTSIPNDTIARIKGVVVQ